MSDAFSFKVGAQLPSRTMTLTGNGLTSLASIDANTMLFVYRPKGTATRTTIPATIVDAAAMKIQIDFGTVDTATAGSFDWEIEAQIGGKKLYWPEKGFYSFSVTANI